MIAARAIVHHASLVTMNVNDYTDVPNLSPVPW
jgi:predicted nucleic acid-binding protein